MPNPGTLNKSLRKSRVGLRTGEGDQIDGRPFKWRTRGNGDEARPFYARPPATPAAALQS